MTVSKGRRLQFSRAALTCLGILALAAPACAGTYVVSNFADPATAEVFSAPGVGVVVNGIVSTSPPTSLYVYSDVNPQDADTTVTFGAGDLTLASPSLGRAYAEVGFGAFAGASESVDTTPYNYFELSFARGNRELNINALLYSASPTGPNIYYDAGAINVVPPTGGGPFNVFFPILPAPGFNRADVNGFYFEIDVAGDSLGSSWAIDRYALTSAGVPEPSSWFLLIVGIGGLGGVARLARRKATLPA